MVQARFRNTVNARFYYKGHPRHVGSRCPIARFAGLAGLITEVPCHTMPWQKNSAACAAPFGAMPENRISIAVMIRLVRPFHRHAEVVGLVLGHLGELDANLFKV